MTTIDFHGRSLPNIGIGTWHMGSNPATYQAERDVIRLGIQHGATVIDTAEMYGEGDSERLVGDAIQLFDRDELFLISKFYPQHAAKHDASAYQILLAWTIRNQHTLAIPQTSKPGHMLANIAAGQIVLDTADLQALDRAFPVPTSKQPLAII